MILNVKYKTFPISNHGINLVFKSKNTTAQQHIHIKCTAAKHVFMI